MPSISIFVWEGDLVVEEEVGESPPEAEGLKLTEPEQCFLEQTLCWTRTNPSHAAGNLLNLIQSCMNRPILLNLIQFPQAFPVLTFRSVTPNLSGASEAEQDQILQKFDLERERREQRILEESGRIERNLDDLIRFSEETLKKKYDENKPHYVSKLLKAKPPVRISETLFSSIYLSRA